MRLITLTFTLLALAISVVAFPAGASAEITWAAPPECVQSQWARDGDRLGLYDKFREDRRVIQYGGGTEIQYIWVYAVSVPSYPYGMQDAGTSEKVCGADWIPDNAGIA